MKKMTLLFFLLSIFVGCNSQANVNFNKDCKSSIKLLNSIDLDVSARSLFDYTKLYNKHTLLCLDNHVLTYFDLDSKFIYKRDTLHDLINKETIGIKLYGKNLYISTAFPSYIYEYDLVENQMKTYSTQQDPKQAVVPPVPFLYGSGNMLIKNNHLFLPGKCFGEGAYMIGDRPTGVCINLRSGDINYFMDYPKKYYQSNWGGMYYRNVYATNNSNEDELVFSFPACNELYVYNVVSQTVVKKSGGSKSFESIKPFSKDISLQIVKIKDEAISYYFKNYSYSFIVFDNKKKLYYRMVEYPNINFGRTNDFSKPRGVIILDEAFNFLGEMKLPTKTYSAQIFVTDTGFIIPTYNKISKKRGFDAFQVVL
jgi:hypothetical protein